MASLLSFVKKKANAAYHGINPLDNGQGWTSRPVQRPGGNRSVVQQGLGAGGAVGKAVVQAPIQFGVNASNQLYNRAVAPVLDLPRQDLQHGPALNPFVAKAQRFSGATGTPLQTATSGIGTALTIAAPGLTKGIETGVAGATGFIAPKVANRAAVRLATGQGAKALPRGLQTGSRIVSNAGIGGGFNAAAVAGQPGAKPVDVAKGFGQGAAFGASIPIAGKVIKGGAQATAKGAKNLPKALPRPIPLGQEGKLRLPGLGGQNLHYSSSNGSTVVSGNRNEVLKQLNPTKENQGFSYSGKRDDVLKQIKLNQGGYVRIPGKNNPDEVSQYANVFNISKKEADAQLSKLKEQESVTAGRQIRKPKDGIGVPEGVKEQLGVPKVKFKRGATENTNLNPLKVDIPEVRPGEYFQARANAQAAERPIQFSASQVKKSIDKLSPGEKGMFWKAVESPETITSPKLADAVKRWNDLSNRVHATSQALGGNTNYVVNYARHNWDLADPAQAAKYEELVNARGGAAVDPYSFGGVNNQNRAFKSITEGEAAGFKLKNPGNPAQDVIDYANGVSSALKKQALTKGVTEADMNSALKNRSFDLGNGNTIPVSEEGLKQIRAFEQHTPSTNKAVRGLRTTNAALKTSILSGGQFHPINISVLRAGPSIALAGHPVRAAVGVGRTFRPLLPGGKGAVDRVMNKALQDGMVEKAAKIGAPYGQAGYNVEGTALKSGVGHKLVFERQMPMMHDQVVRSVISDLEKKGIPLDSQAARQAGIAANSTMGFINREALNISPKLRQAMSDVMLAGQFTPSKIMTISKVGKGGVAGKYARSDVASNVVAATAIITGLGYALGQKSDSLRDSLLRALINPAVPTPTKDKKGNNIEYRVPMTYTAEIAKLLGLKLKRQNDGHLGVDFKPTEALSPHGGLVEWMRSRLSPSLSSGVKVATNTNFADKPLSDPNAPIGQRAIQTATTLGQGYLPIGTQGIPNTKFVKEHVPGSAREILEANTPGTNPVLKSGASSFGFSPRTDQTVGKAKETAQYFSGLEEANKGLNRQERDALDLYAGSKKNPVTGKYDIKPSYNDTPAKSSALLQNPKVVDRLIKLNKDLSESGQKVDPLWQGNKEQITKYLEYSRMAPGSADKKDWYNKNKSWFKPLSDARGDFFNSLPPGDPNKPKLDLQYPEASSGVKGLMDTYSNITDGKQKGEFLDAHPELIKQWNAQAKYTNDVRERLGYAPFKNYPEPTTQLQSYMDKYNAADKPTRKAIRNGNPKAYQSMIAYYDSLDLYNINKEGALNQLQGEPDQTSKQNKAIKNLAKDIYQNADGTYQIVPAGWMQGLGDGSGYGYGRRGGRSGSAKSKFSGEGLKTANSNKITPPKGVKVKQLTYAKGKGPKKLSVAKIPTTYKRKRIA